MKDTTIYTAVSDHRPRHKALGFTVGESVTVYPRRTPWPGMVMVQNAGGQVSWIPLRCINDARPLATVIADHVSKELHLNHGEAVIVVEWDEAMGWCWGATERGTGWFPMSVIGK